MEVIKISTPIVSSISYDQIDIIKNIMAMFTNNKIDCDPTYSKGIFYKGIQPPTYKFDLLPQVGGVVQADARNLPLENESIESLMFDPPFVGGWKGEGKNGIIKERFSSYRDVPSLWEFYNSAIGEFYRVLKPNGILVFKCQDTVENHRNYFSHCEIMNLAVKVGFYPKDLFILLAKNRLIQANLSKQAHARKYHSYFWVFEKAQKKVSYSVKYENRSMKEV